MKKEDKQPIVQTLERLFETNDTYYLIDFKRMKVAQAVEETKAGKVEFRVDKTSIVHSTVGKVSFEEAKLVDNLRTFLQAVIHAKPPAAKGKYIRTMFVSSTMGPSFRITEDILEN